MDTIHISNPSSSITIPPDIIVGSIESMLLLFECAEGALSKAICQKRAFSNHRWKCRRSCGVERVPNIKTDQANFQKNACHMLTPIHGQKRRKMVLGYSVLYEELVQNNSDGKTEMSAGKDGSQEVMLKSINSELLMERVASIIEKSRGEYSKDLEGYMWCKSSSSNIANTPLIILDLTMLAVESLGTDPSITF